MTGRNVIKALNALRERPALHQNLADKCEVEVGASQLLGIVILLALGLLVGLGTICLISSHPLGIR